MCIRDSEQPAEPGNGRREDDRPLLAVDVVDQGDDRRLGDRRSPEGHAVLGVDDDVEDSFGAFDPPERGQGARVDAQPRAIADHPVAVDGLGARRRAVRGAEEGDVMSAGAQAGADILGVPFGTPAFGVGEVAPVEDSDTHAGVRLSRRR